MYFFKPNRIEWISFFALMPVLDIAVNWLLFGPRFISMEVLIKSYPLITVYGFISWYLHIYVMRMLRIRFPLFSQTDKRLIILLGTHVSLTAGTLFLIFWTYSYFNFLGYVLDYHQAKWCLVIAILLTLTATGTWEGSYIYQLWKESLKEKESLQKMNLQQEFDVLKNQVNPHFLFNSLNSLSSLIHENPKEAEVFLDEMSKVYRYILKNDHQDLIELETEIRYLHSYHHLLKTRYGKNLILDVRIPETSDGSFVPPLTLQILLENAVKHNVIMKEKPLHVTIDYEGSNGNRIVVKNNIRKKTVRIQSNKTGLANIAAKYKLLHQPEVVIHETPDEFSVSIPLIKQPISNYEDTDH